MDCSRSPIMSNILLVPSKRSGWSGFGRTSFQSRRGAVLRVAYVRVRSALVGGARAEHVTCYLHRSRNVKRAYIRGRPGEYWGRGVDGRGKATPPAGPVKNCLLRPCTYTYSK